MSTRRATSSRQRGRRTTIVLCIVASVAFWVTIKLSNTYTTTEPIDIEYQLPRGVAFAQAPPTMLEASVRATGWELLRQSLRTTDRAIVVDSLDVRSNPDGIVNIRNAVASSFAGVGLSVDAMTNERVVLRTEPVGAKRVPVRLVSAIDYAPGFSLERPLRVTPDSIDVTGPRSVLDSITSWPTDTLRLSGVRDSVLAVALLESPRVPQVRLSGERVEVVVVAEQFTEKTVYVPVFVPGLPAGDSVRVFPRQVLIRFPVGLSRYESIGREDFRAEVDVSGAAVDEPIVLAVRIVRQPSGIGRVSAQPSVVEVFVYRR